MKKFLGVSSWERNFGGGHCYGLLFEKYLLILNGLSAITGGFVSRWMPRWYLGLSTTASLEVVSNSLNDMLWLIWYDILYCIILYYIILYYIILYYIILYYVIYKNFVHQVGNQPRLLYPSSTVSAVMSFSQTNTRLYNHSKVSFPRFGSKRSLFKRQKAASQSARWCGSSLVPLK